MSWDEVVRESGLAREEIEAAARTYWEAESVISCWAMGLTQHKTAVACIQEVVNLHLLYVLDISSINKFDIDNIDIRASNNNIHDKMLENLKNF